MKFEKLENSKFKVFETSELQDAFKIIGGVKQATTYKSSRGRRGNDTIDYATQAGPHAEGHSGGIDYERTT